MLDSDIKIEEYINSLNFNNISEHEKKKIFSGEKSFLSSKYSIDIDDCKEMLCFRSEYNFDEYICEENEKLKLIAEKQFYHMVEAGKTEYKDLETYDMLIKNLRKKNAACNNCIECKVLAIQDYSNKKQEERNANMFRATSDIANLHSMMMTQIMRAVNNYGSYFRSYSKSIVIPLFKYHGNSDKLFINKLISNSVKVVIDVSFFDWWEKDNQVGRNRNYQDRIELFIPIKYLSSSGKIREIVFNQYDFEDRDLDNVEIMIEGITIDISQINRNAFDQYYIEHLEEFFKRFASYKNDEEILTTDYGFYYSLDNPKSIQFIRFVFLLKVSGLYSEIFERKIRECFQGEVNGVTKFVNENFDAVKYVFNYISDETVFEYEKMKFFDINQEYAPFMYFFNMLDVKEGFMKFVKNVINRPQIYSGLFSKEIFVDLLGISEINFK